MKQSPGKARASWPRMESTKMYLVYSPSQGIFDCSADCAQYLAGTREAIVSGVSVCVWIVPGTLGD